MSDRKEKMVLVISELRGIIRFALGGCIFMVFSLTAGGALTGENAVNHSRFCSVCRKLGRGTLGGILFSFCGEYFGYGAWKMISLRGLLAFLYLGILIMAASADRDTGIIGNRFPVEIALLGAASLWLFPEHGMAERIAGMGAASVPMLTLTLIKKDAFGGGDIKLMAVSGFFLGWKAALAAMVIGFFAGGAYCAFLFAKRKVSFGDSFALGPFLALGLGTALFWGEYLVQWYFSI